MGKKQSDRKRRRWTEELAGVEAKILLRRAMECMHNGLMASTEIGVPLHWVKDNLDAILKLEARRAVLLTRLGSKEPYAPLAQMD